MVFKVLGVLCLAAGASIAVANAYPFLRRPKSGRNVSLMPLAGGLLLVLGLLAFSRTRPYAWIGALVDVGTVTLVVAVPLMLWDAWQTSSANVLHRFESHVEGRRDVISLFRCGRSVIQTDFDPPAPSENGTFTASISRCAEWRLEGDTYCVDGYGGGRELRIAPEGDGFAATEQGDAEGDAAYRLDGLRLVEAAK